MAPDRLKPDPLKVADLIVTGAVPVDVSVTGRVDDVFTVTFPKAKLAVLMFNPGTFAPVASSCIEKVLETPPALAVSVTAFAIVTADTVAANPALVAFAGTVTIAGTAMAALLLVKLTLIPLLPAAELSVTVHASLPAPVTDARLHEIALNAGEAAVLVPAAAVLLVLPPDALPHPEIATATKEQADNASSFTNKLSGMWSDIRLHRRHEPNTFSPL